MSKVLFSHSYFLRYDPKQWELQQPFAPLGTIFAASLLRENGHTVSLHDVMFVHSPDEIIPVLERETPDFLVLYDDGFNYLTKMCLTNMREAAWKMAQLAKGKGCKVIVASSDSTDHFKEYLENGADFIILGEAEQTLLELINAIKNNSVDFTNIQGLAFKKETEIVKTPKRNVMRELDSLPLPAWDLVDIEKYQNVWRNKYGYFSINIATTRGCPYKCNWCAKPIYGNRYNTRSPENVMKELKMLKENYGFEHIWFCDDIFGLQASWVQHFSELVKKEKLNFNYKIQSRADLLVQENYIKALSESGCDNVWMGAESGSQKILDAMDKGTTVEQIYTATKMLKKYGIKPALFLQFGYLGETMEDIQLTIKMLNDLLPEDIGVSVSYPLPGTGFYEKVKQDLKEKTNWTDSDELALMFKNTYQPKFYKQLHKYVHKNYRKHQGFESLKNVFTQPAMINLKTLKRALSLAYYIPITVIEKNKLKSTVNV